MNPGTATMARPKKPAKTSTIRLTAEAHRLASIASGFSGESMVEYVSRVVVESARRDIDRGYGELKHPKGKGGG